MQAPRHRSENASADGVTRKDGEERSGSKADPFLDLFYNLTKLVTYPRRHDSIDHVSDGFYSVRFIPHGKKPYILLSVGWRRKKPLWEYAFHKEGHGSVRDPSVSKVPYETFPDWDCGLFHLVDFLFMTYSNGLSVESRLGYMLWGACIEDIYEC
jgi:hypothetical protein